MKWSFVIRQKVKIATLLSGILVIIMLASLSMNQAIQDMDRSLESVFVDRLQPAVDLVFLSERLHHRRMVMHEYLTGSMPFYDAEAVESLHKDNSESDRLISCFEKTLLIPMEVEKLAYFKGRMKAYRLLENSVLELVNNNHQDQARHLFEQQGGAIFQEGVITLHSIAQIQSDTGRKAVKSAHSQAAGGLINTFLLIAVCITIALVILGLLRSDSTTNQNSEMFHLN
ncbi:MCP four helix bundle domain-containing protein [Dyadobacter sp. 3J3]|uniref:MCP four helix bundle domain-containing protein n=1 Tax=Dyadobacter sp. 3J3 TaxID=2606600 RepID=UPI00135928D8|nr:MCP four helix bundle domain-containing protein [Dyadobacter sp. 3J3]